jgi:hypothetical protein
MEIKTTYRHYKTEHGSVTLCLQFSEKRSKRLFKVGLAFCSKLEESYNKKKGRLIARGRAEALRSKFGRSFLMEENQLRYEVAILSILKNNEIHGPSWWPKAREAIIEQLEGLKADV